MSTRPTIKVFQVTSQNATQEEQQKTPLLTKLMIGLTISAILAVTYDTSFRSGPLVEGQVVSNSVSKNNAVVNIEVLSGPHKGDVYTDVSMSVFQAAKFQPGVSVHTHIHRSWFLNDDVANNTSLEVSQKNVSKSPKP